MVNEVVEWALLGHSAYNLTEAVAAKYPDFAANDVIALVAHHFCLAGQADGVNVRGFAIEGYRELYRKALKIGDLATALKALARLEKAGNG